MVKSNIHFALEVYAAEEQNRFQAELVVFALSYTKKSLNDIIDSIRKIQNAMATIKRKNQEKIREKPEKK